MEKPINPNALASVLLRKFVEMGMLDERKFGSKSSYFLTHQGRIILANFGVDESELYKK